MASPARLRGQPADRLPLASPVTSPGGRSLLQACCCPWGRPAAAFITEWVTQACPQGHTLLTAPCTVTIWPDQSQSRPDTDSLGGSCRAPHPTQHAST